MTTTIFWAAVAAIAVAAVARGKLRRNKRELEQVRKRLDEAETVAQAVSYCLPGDAYIETRSSNNANGVVTVCRRYNGVPVEVKRFYWRGTADDEAHAVRCAEELRDMINDTV